MPNDEDIKIGIKTTADTSGAEEARESLSGVDKAAQEAAAATEELNESVGKEAQTREEAAQAVKEHLKVVDDHVAAIEEEAEAHQRMAKEIEQIRALQQAQLLDNLSRGVRDLARTAKENGMGDFAEDLERASTGMRVASTIIQGGLGLGQLITQLGGVRAALGAAVTFMTGPAGIALAASTAAFVALQYAVKVASDEMDEFARQAAKPALYGEEAAKASEEAVSTLLENIKKEREALDTLISRRERELELIRLKNNEKLAEIDADAAVASAKVDAKEAAGQISAPEAIAERARIREAAEQKRHKIDAQTRKAEIDQEEAQAQAAEAARDKKQKERAELEKRRNAKSTGFTDDEKKRFKELNDLAEAARAQIRSTRGKVVSKEEFAKTKQAERDLENISKERERLAQAAANPRKIFDTPEIRDKIADIDKELEKLKEKAEKERSEADSVRERNTSQQRAANTRREGRRQVNAVRAGTRIAQSAQSLQEKKNAEQKRAAEQAAAELAKQRDRADREAAGLGRSASSAAKGAPAKLQGAVNRAAAALQDGVHSGELEALSKAVDNLTSALVDKRGSEAAELGNIKAKIDKLASQVKNLRPTR